MDIFAVQSGVFSFADFKGKASKIIRGVKQARKKPRKSRGNSILDAAKSIKLYKVVIKCNKR